MYNYFIKLALSPDKCRVSLQAGSLFRKNYRYERTTAISSPRWEMLLV
jgi:hypothetical protein